jgi:hypothetical protein
MTYKWNPTSIVAALLCLPCFLAILSRPALAQSQLAQCPSDLQSVWNNCQGTKKIESGPNAGDVYVGEYQDGKRSGQGKYMFANGNKYEGEWKSNLPNGQGVFTYAVGGHYVGEYRDGKQNGQGVFTYADGSKYIGESKDSKKDGKGTYTFANGERYVGEWSADKREGFGTQYAADGSIKNQGLWSNSNFVRTADIPSTKQQAAAPIASGQQPSQNSGLSSSENEFQAYLNKNPMGSPQGAKPTNFQFVVTPNDSQQLTALNIKPPSNLPHANPNLFVHCGNEEYGNGPSEKSKLSGILLEDGKFFIITAQSTYIVLDDTVAGESKQDARYIANFDTCKMETFTPANADIGRLRIAALKNQNEMMYLGPTFKCPEFKCGALGSVVADQSYLNEKLGRADIALYQPIQAFRHVFPEQRNALRDQLARELKSIEQNCRLPKKFALDPLGNLEGTEKFAPCVKAAYGKLRATMVAQGYSSSSSDMREEIDRDVYNHVFGQYLLRHLGFLPKDASIDGSFGQGTRSAIMAAQAEAKLDQSGFLSRNTFQYLLAKLEKIESNGNNASPTVSLTENAPLQQAGQPTPGSLKADASVVSQGLINYLSSPEIWKPRDSVWGTPGACLFEQQSVYVVKKDTGEEWSRSLTKVRHNLASVKSIEIKSTKSSRFSDNDEINRSMIESYSKDRGDFVVWIYGDKVTYVYNDLIAVHPDLRKSGSEVISRKETYVDRSPIIVRSESQADKLKGLIQEVNNSCRSTINIQTPPSQERETIKPAMSAQQQTSTNDSDKIFNSAPKTEGIILVPGAEPTIAQIQSEFRKVGPWSEVKTKTQFEARSLLVGRLTPDVKAENRCGRMNMLHTLTEFTLYQDERTPMTAARGYIGDISVMRSPIKIKESSNFILVEPNDPTQWKAGTSFLYWITNVDSSPRFFVLPSDSGQYNNGKAVELVKCSEAQFESDKAARNDVISPKKIVDTLECGTSVDCRNHTDVIAKMRNAFRILNNSQCRPAKAYADTCFETLQNVQKLPDHLKGDPGIYYNQLQACNNGLVYINEPKRCEGFR